MEANVLVTTAGTIVAQGIIKSLKLAGIAPGTNMKYKIFAVDMSPEAAGLYRSKAGFLVPPIDSSRYIDSIVDVCKTQAIEAVYVGADEELLIMSNAQEEIRKKTGAIVVTNPPNVISTCSDKWETFKFLKRNNFPCADSALPEDIDRFASDHEFPAIVKPREGHGSLHVHRVNNLEEMNQAISDIVKCGWRPIIQEFIPTSDQEFTTGVTVDSERNTIMSSIAMRRILESGQTYKAFIDDFQPIRKTSEEVALKLGSRGPINIQGRFHEGQLKIFEVNPRFSASTPMRAVAGVNEADIIFRNQVLHEKIKVESYRHLVCLRYWNEVYVPLSTYSKTVDQKIVIDSDSFIPSYF
ncbi:MAG: ATP-grasp domain-containing protein [Nitrososphaerota archaeon]|nr:ATP-grasp domain-containing protein [Nitrososphaerota archaeon]